MPAPRPSDSIARNSVYAFAAQLTGAAFTAALTLYLARALGPGEFGLFALALAVGALVVLPADLGLSASAGRFVAEHRGDHVAVARVVRDALGLKLGVAALSSAALFALAPLIASAYDLPDLTWPIRAVAIAVFGQGLMMLFASAFVAVGRVAAYLRVVLTESAVEFGATVALVLLGAGATGAAFGRSIGYGAGALAAAILAARVLGRAAVVPWSPSREGARRIARYAGALAVVDIAFSVFQQVDALLIGGFLGAASVGLFQAPMRIAVLLHYPGLALASGVTPRLADNPDEPPNVTAFLTAARYVVLFQSFLLAPLLVWAQPLTTLLLGSDFEESADVLRALTPYVFLAGLAPLVSLAANYLGAARLRIPVALGALAVNVVLDVILIPAIGIVGAAIGTGAAFCLYVPAHLEICRRRLGFSLRPLGRTLARSLVAAGAMAAVLLAFGTEELSPAEWVGGALGGTAIFGLVLLGLREVSVTEMRGLAGAAKAGVLRT